MNNAIFDKTMCVMCVNVQLVIRWNERYGVEAMIAKTNFHSRSISSENLVAIEMRKFKVKFDKLIYVNMCILDISKMCFTMSTCYRSFMKNVKLCISDSLIYHIECDDVYTVIKCDINKFSTSDYAIDNAYDIMLVNKKVPCLMKDENNGAIMIEFVGLRTKMYALYLVKKILRRQRASRAML